MNRKVLILGDDNRSFLASARSLGRLGLEVHVAPDDWSSPVLCSRYVARKITLPPPDLSLQDWMKTLIKIHKREHYDFILPCNEKGILPLLQNKDAFSDTILGIVNDEAFDAFFDKIKTRAVAETVGVPVAKGRQFKRDENTADLIAEFGLPVAIKPSRSFTDENLFSRRSVKLAHTPAQLHSALRSMDNLESYFIEAMFPGVGAGISILAKDGEVCQAFQHQRVHEPETGGGSSYRKSVPLDPEMLEDVRKLALATKLTGLAMFEFRVNPETGARILLEVNARLWGSVPLAIANGIDFPALYYKLMVEDEVVPQIPYESAVFARNLVNDLSSVTDRAVLTLTRPNAARIRDLVTTVSGYWRYAAGLDHSDTWAPDDPRPHRKSVQAFKKDLHGRVAGKIPIMSTRLQTQERRALPDLLDVLPPRPTIAVLCRGNICRSPFAAALLKRKIKERGLAISVIEGGTMPHTDRASPKNAKIAAKEFGVSLARHRSRHVSQIALSQADLILHFDPLIEAELRRVARTVDVPLFNLVCLAPGAEHQMAIIDPVDADVDGFRRVYRQIDMALDRFLELYTQSLKKVDRPDKLKAFA